MWYVVLDGEYPGVYGNYKNAMRSKYENAPVYKYHSREKALEKYNEFLCNRLNIPPVNPANFNRKTLPYDLMPRYMGEISVIPEVFNSYQLTVHVNYKYRYIVFILYDIKEVFYAVRSLPLENNIIKQYLYGITFFSKFKSNINMLISERSIAMAFEQGWITQWKQKGILVKDFNLWAETYVTLRRNKNLVGFHKSHSINEQVIEVVQFEICKSHYQQLKQINPTAYEMDHYKYFIQDKIPPSKYMTFTELS